MRNLDSATAKHIECLPGPHSTFSGLCNCGEPIALKVLSAKAETSDPVAITNETSLPSTLTQIFQYLLGLLISVTAFRYDVSIGSV